MTGFSKLLKEIEEEDIGVSLLTTHYRSREELQFFGEDDRRRVVEILKKLSRDSKSHKKNIGRCDPTSGAKAIMKTEYLKTLWHLRFEKMKKNEESTAWTYQEILDQC